MIETILQSSLIAGSSPAPGSMLGARLKDAAVNEVRSSIADKPKAVCNTATAPPYSSNW